MTATLMERADALASVVECENCRRTKPRVEWGPRTACDACGGKLGLPTGADEAAVDLAMFADAFAEALPGLYRECACVVSSGSPDVPLPPCTCGVDEHNATLDALADKLGIPVEQRRRQP